MKRWMALLLVVVQIFTVICVPSDATAVTETDNVEILFEKSADWPEGFLAATLEDVISETITENTEVAEETVFLDIIPASTVEMIDEAISSETEAIPATEITMTKEDGNSCGEGLTWHIDADGILTISGSGKITASPWYSNKTQIKSVVIEDGVTGIGACAFSGCNAITSVLIPNSVTIIENNAFSGCTNLKAATIPGSVNSIGQHAFYECFNMTTLTLEPGVKVIDDAAFTHCESLENVTLGYGLTSIGWASFSYCSSIEELHLPTSLRVIDKYAFYYCSGLTELKIPYGVYSIGNYAFSGCTGMKSILVPKSVTTIETYAFPWYGESFIMFAYQGSKAHRYAQTHNYTFVTLDDGGILPIIESKHIFTYPLVGGTVLASDGNNAMRTYLTILQEASFADVELNVVLPEGFSFEQQSLVTEKNVSVGELSEDRTFLLPTIYPIYIDLSVQESSYSLSIELTAKKSNGQLVEKKTAAIFYKPSMTRNVAQSLTSFAAEDYEFSLDSAPGSGSIYNQETARLCAMLSDMAYNRDNIETFLTSGLGFSNFERQGIAVNNDLTHLLGRYYASKKIIVDGEIKNLVYVVCRGSSGVPLVGREWLSNFDPGSGNTHAGFDGAASRVKTELEEYCAAHHFATKDTYIVVTGHSRAAAAANLVGHWLNTEAVLAKKENISVYTFATPTVDRRISSEEVGYAGHENIFNWVNYQDPIRNSASMRYYGRYGSTTLFAYGSGLLGGLTYNDGYCTYTLPNDGWTYTMAELLNAILYEMDPQDVFHKGRFVANCTRLLSNRKKKYPGSEIGELGIAHGMEYYYKAVITDARAEDDEDFVLVNIATQAALDYFKQEYCNESNETDVVIDSYHCPIDLYVYDLNGNLVGSIVNQVVSQDDDTFFLYVDGGSLNMATMKSKRDNYTVRIVGYDDGTMKHCLQNVGTDATTSIQIRENIPITNGGVLEVNDSGYVGPAGESEAEILAAYETYEEEDEMEWVLENLEPRELTVDDAIYLVWHTLFPEMYPVVERAVDYNGDGEVTDADAVVLLWHILFPDEYSLT